MCCLFFFFKQKTAYEMRISDWSSDVCSSDLGAGRRMTARLRPAGLLAIALLALLSPLLLLLSLLVLIGLGRPVLFRQARSGLGGRPFAMIKFRSMRDLRDGQGALLPDAQRITAVGRFLRSEEHTSELQSLMRIAYAVFC